MTVSNACGVDRLNASDGKVTQTKYYRRRKYWQIISLVQNERGEFFSFRRLYIFRSKASANRRVYKLIDSD